MHACHFLRQLGAAAILLAVCTLSLADGSAPEPRNVVQLSASGTVEAAQDWLTLTLSVTKEGTDANTVQAYLRQATDSALAEVKKAVQPGSMEVHTGNFNLQPRYTNEGRISGWVGSTELVLEGSDFARISATAARAQPMTINNLNFGLSRQARAQLETQAQSMAIGNFKAKAMEVARSFGFSDYVLREVAVNAADPYPGPRPVFAAMSIRAKALDAAPVALESGKSLVVVSVSGSVQLK